MEWVNELLGNWELLSTIIGWVVGIIGIGGLTGVWNTARSGRKMYKTYYENKPDGWTDAEKDEYIQKSAKFFQNITTLWNMVFDNKKKK